MGKPLKIKIVDSRNKFSNIKVVAWSLFFFAAVFGPGVLVQSEAMQWAGFCIVAAMVLYVLRSLNGEEMTVDQAQKAIQELAEAEQKE